MRKVLLVGLLLTAFVGCERYKYLNEYLVQDTWTGKLYIIVADGHNGWTLKELKQ